MVKVVERVGRHVDENNHPETMTVLKFGRDHGAPPARCHYSNTLAATSIFHPEIASLPRCVHLIFPTGCVSAFFLSASNVPRVMAAYCLSRKLTRKRQRPGAAKYPGNSWS